MDPVEKGKAEMGSVERLISRLPGIKGYREKELRRAADKQVRDGLARKLETVAHLLVGQIGRAHV